jgi:hypothetical protein
MFPYHMLAQQIYEERLRDVERRRRILAHYLCLGSTEPRPERGPLRTLSRALARLRRRPLPRPA